jgi:allantoicase
VRLRIHPDGGVARLRILGEPLPDLRRHAGPLDVAALLAGGAVAGASDARFAPASNLLLPGEPHTPGDGWETRRRRGPGHDWVTIRLATEAVVERVEVDTTHFVGNYPESCVLALGDDHLSWTTVLSRTPLSPHARHVFPLDAAPPATFARFEIHPDGGVARLRLFGSVTADGWRRAGTRLLDALPAAQAEAELRACCGSRRWAREMVARRPFAKFAGLLDAADEVWDSLDADDVEEALAAHPRIGDRATGWSRAEQSGAADASPEILQALAEGNRAYEARFDRTFVIRASGRSAGEMLAALQKRLGNDDATELRTAAGEQRQITRLRLERMVQPDEGVREASAGGRGTH